DEIDSGSDQATLATYAPGHDRWHMARLTEAGRNRMAEIATDHSDDWQSLGVALLHRLIVDTLLDGKSLPAPKYVRDVNEVVQSLREGDAAGRDATGQQGQGGKFGLACLVMPATL